MDQALLGDIAIAIEAWSDADRRRLETLLADPAFREQLQLKALDYAVNMRSSGYGPVVVVIAPASAPAPRWLDPSEMPVPCPAFRARVPEDLIALRRDALELARLNRERPWLRRS